MSYFLRYFLVYRKISVSFSAVIELVWLHIECVTYPFLRERKVIVLEISWSPLNSISNFGTQYQGFLVREITDQRGGTDQGTPLKLHILLQYEEAKSRGNQFDRAVQRSHERIFFTLM